MARPPGTARRGSRPGPGGLAGSRGPTRPAGGPRGPAAGPRGPPPDAARHSARKALDEAPAPVHGGGLRAWWRGAYRAVGRSVAAVCGQGGPVFPIRPSSARPAGSSRTRSRPSPARPILRRRSGPARCPWRRRPGAGSAGTFVAAKVPVAGVPGPFVRGFAGGTGHRQSRLRGRTPVPPSVHPEPGGCPPDEGERTVAGLRGVGPHSSPGAGNSDTGKERRKTTCARDFTPSFLNMRPR